MGTPTFKEIFHQLQINLSIIGIPSSAYKLSPKFYVMTVLISMMLLEEVCFFVHKMAPENFLELTILAPCICAGALSVLKIIPVVQNRGTVFDLVEKLELLSADILNDHKKRTVVRDDIESLKTLMKYYFILNAGLISVYNFSTPIFILSHYISTKEEIFPLPYAVIVPFSTERWSTWMIVYLHSISCGFICVLFFTTVDGLYFVLTSYVCSVFAVLSNEIRQLTYANEDKLNEMVKRHQDIIELADDLEVIFTLPNFFNVVVGSIEICALGFTLMIGDWSDVLGCLLFLSSVLLQIFMMSVFGENLMRESAKVGETAFLCEWYKMNHRSKKTILLLITRSQKAQRLTANKFSVICIESFTSIIKNSWSYFTILRTMYFSENN